MSNRWWTYQRERFPVLAHGPLILAFSLSAMSYSALLRGAAALNKVAALVAFVTSLFFFLQLRIADEFKDAEDDARWRPYRPVPRGLVTLRELGWIGLGAGVIQLAGSFWLRPSLALLLAGGLALPRAHEQGVLHSRVAQETPRFLHAVSYDHPAGVRYLRDGMRLVRCRRFAAARSLVVRRGQLLNGIVIEIGSKIRAPQDEEEGVETYSFLWGRQTALAAWLGAMFLTGLFAWRGSMLIGFDGPVALPPGRASVLFGAARSRVPEVLPAPGMGKRFELLSGIWTPDDVSEPRGGPAALCHYSERRVMKFILIASDARGRMGGKAAALAALEAVNMPVPAWFVVSPEACPNTGAGIAEKLDIEMLVPGDEVRREIAAALQEDQSR